MKNTLLVLLATAAASQLHAQGPVYAESAHIPVSSGTTALRAAWAGGYDNPQLAMADLNNDGRLDLVVYERDRETKAFINVGMSGAPQYKYEPAYSRHIPYLSEFIYMLDYNRDGVTDLFHRGGNGLSFDNPLARGGVGFEAHRGYYHNDTLKFQFYRQLFYPYFGGMVNAYSNPFDVPGIADVDGDGDIDFIAFGNFGSAVAYYQNMQVEDGLPTDSIRVKLKTNCWGRFEQGIARTATLGINCGPDFFRVRPEDGSLPVADPGQAARMTAAHASNTICLLDIDGDGDQDVLNGNLIYPDIQLLVNGKTQYSWPRDTIVSQDTLWQAAGTMLNLPFYPQAHFLDADADGKRDIIITPHGEGSGVKNWNNFWLYKNVGTAAAPQFQYQRQDFLQDVSVDAGSNSYPAFYDFNRDGKKDLFIGSTGLHQPGGTYRGQLVYLQNNSTPGLPAMSLQTMDAFGLSAYNLRGAAPAFADLDNDGKDDLILGHANGRLSWIKNMASSGTAQPSWTGAPQVLRAQNGDTIDVGDAAVPTAYDLNKDGRKDLLIGSQTGAVAYYKANTGSVPQLELVSAQVGGVKADPQNAFVGYSAPFVGVIDNTGVDYMLVGSSSGRVHRFDGFQGGNTSVMYPMVDTIYSGLRLPAGRSAVAVADVDGDGWYDLVAGNQTGGVKLYKQVRVVGVGADVAPPSASFTIYPNPAGETVYLRREAAGEASIRVMSATGQLVTKAIWPTGEQVAALDVNRLANGVYFVEVAGAGKLDAQRTTVQRLSVVR